MAPDAEEPLAVRTKAIQVDPATSRIVWMNESAEQGAAPGESEHALGLSLAEVLPMGEGLGLPDAMRHVADSGEPRHLRANLVSSGKGSVAFVISVYRLPDGTILLLAENTYQLSRPAEAGVPRRTGRRGR